MRHLVIATAFLVLMLPAGAADIWDKVFTGKPAGANLTPAQTAELAREMCRCVPSDCEFLISTGMAVAYSPKPLGRLLAAALEGGGITRADARAVALNERKCER